MGKAKKLDLTLEQLKAIAMELNKNTIANKTRAKEDKIGTDRYIRKFNITRKDFSESIKDTCISYNRSTFLYDIGDCYIADINGESVKEEVRHIESNTKESIDNTKVEEEKVKKVTKKVTPKESNDNSIDIVKLLEEQLPIVLEIVKEYEKNKIQDKAIGDNTLIIDEDKLTGEDAVRSFKTYKKVLDGFSVYCKNRKEKQKDLLAMALIEFMEKYK